MPPPLILFTAGDHNGIGPEVALRAALAARVRRSCRPVLVGPIDAWSHYAERFRMRVTLAEIEGLPACASGGALPVIDIPGTLRIAPGRLSAAAGRLSGMAIERAARLCAERAADGMVTAPVSKEAMHRGGYLFPGQTEMLAMLTKTPGVMMMLVARSLRVALATVHIPIAAVPERITGALLREKLAILGAALRRDFGIARPRVALLGLNPHAGEGGAIGTEEERVIIPALRNQDGLRADGPFPADGFFGARTFERYDAVLAMYHDQGLIPLKLLGFASGVNVSCGLPIVRTSPDHGTAFNIAGKGTADPGSMIEAALLAASIARRRLAHKKGTPT